MKKILAALLLSYPIFGFASPPSPVIMVDTPEKMALLRANIKNIIYGDEYLDESIQRWSVSLDQKKAAFIQKSISGLPEHKANEVFIKEYQSAVKSFGDFRITPVCYYREIKEGINGKLLTYEAQDKSYRLYDPLVSPADWIIGKSQLQGVEVVGDLLSANGYHPMLGKSEVMESTFLLSAMGDEGFNKIEQALKSVSPNYGVQRSCIKYESSQKNKRIRNTELDTLRAQLLSVEIMDSRNGKVVFDIPLKWLKTFN